MKLPLVVKPGGILASSSMLNQCPTSVMKIYQSHFLASALHNPRSVVEELTELKAGE